MTLLEVSGLLAGYRGLTVVRNVDLRVEPGEIVALLGANGAGKSTTLLALSGLAEQQGGTIILDGTDLAGRPAAARARLGLAHVTEDRALFQKLTVHDNLRLGGHGDLGRLDDLLELMPALRPLMRRNTAGLSGGEQQMLALARALMADPSVLLVDELSLGLAPFLVQRLLVNIRQLADDGLGVVMVEQHVDKVLRIADRVVVLARGRVSFAGDPADLLGDRERLTSAYLGIAEDEPQPQSGRR